MIHTYDTLENPCHIFDNPYSPALSLPDLYEYQHHYHSLHHTFRRNAPSQYATMAS